MRYVAQAREQKVLRCSMMGASAGRYHTVVWTAGGEVYTFGSGVCGQLGDGDVHEELVPKVVMALKCHKVVCAAVGMEHTVVCTERVVFTFGYGCYGQLGHGDDYGDEYVPRVVGALNDKKVVGAAAGGHHTVVWTERGQVYTFGRGCHGQLGHGDTRAVRVPKLVEALSGKKVVGAAVGNVHTVVWAEGGEVYTFGHGWMGQLGHVLETGGTRDELLPVVVGALAGNKVVGAAAGGRHTIVWTDVGEVYTFGLGFGGRLGHHGVAMAMGRHPPRVVAAMTGKKVVGAAAGWGHTAVWTEGGEVYTCGYGNHGQLGHKVLRRQTQTSPWIQPDEHVPRRVGALVGKRVVGVVAGGDNTLVWTDRDEVYTFGRGEYGRLGHGVNEKDQHVPLVVGALQDVLH